MNKQPLTAVILAGGEGKRLWPLSTKERPKQFLSLGLNETLLERAYTLLSGFIFKEHIYIVSHKRYTPHICSLLPELPRANLIEEPAARNSAACIAFSTQLIAEKYPDTCMLTFAVDNIVEQSAPFERSVFQGAEKLKAEPFKLICFGVAANSAETGYGYICHSRFQSSFAKVEQFIEKPELKRAEELIRSENCCWSSGIYLWKPSVFLQELFVTSPLFAKQIKNLAENRHALSEEQFYEAYSKLPVLSIDQAVLIKSNNLIVTMIPTQWHDIGAFSSLHSLMPQDENRNVSDADVSFLESKGNLILSSDKRKKIYLIGVSNLVVVETEENTLILNKNDAQKVKELIDYIKKKEPK